jgi:predicted dehydrogenase
LGDLVAVVGSGLLGQIIICLLGLSGVRVLALDYNISRLDLARQMGAEATFDLGGEREDMEATVTAMSNGRGMDGIIISAATKTSEPFQIAGTIARDRARVCLVGMTGTEIPFREFMQKELSLIVSRSYGPGRYDTDFEGRGLKYPEGWIRWTETDNLAECLRLMSPSLKMRLNVGALTSHTFKLEDAEKAYDLVTGGTEPHLGVVLSYNDDKRQAAPFPTPKPGKTTGCVLGVIGAGGFARSVLLPQLKNMNEVTLHTVATQRGASAERTGDTFGFLHTTTDTNAILENPDINAVLIATRHDSHADFCIRALAAGKFVLVEKPLALSRDEINRVIDARNQSTKFFQVGFNRRYAPLSQMVRGRLERHQGTKFILLRINAGHIPAESWVHAADEGGGRILGEVCHFVDLARYLVASPILSVQADAAKVSGGGCDDLNVALRFADGSLATIVYTGLGDSIYSKELIEAYSGGTVVSIDNFQSYTIAEHGKLRKQSSRTQDKGFKGALQDFVRAVSNGGPAPVNETELIETSLATIAIMESLREGRRIELS